MWISFGGPSTLPAAPLTDGGLFDAALLNHFDLFRFNIKINAECLGNAHEKVFGVVNSQGN
jgi:hypothetical protein